MKQLSQTEIQTKIEELCYVEFKPLRKSDLSVIPVDLKGDIAIDDEDDEETDNSWISKVVNEDGVNVTHAPLTKVKHCEKECPDCQCKVKGRVTEHKWIERGNKKYWRHYCDACGNVASPWTGKFNIPAHGSGIMWQSWERESLTTVHADSQNSKYKK